MRANYSHPSARERVPSAPARDGQPGARTAHTASPSSPVAALGFPRPCRLSSLRRTSSNQLGVGELLPDYRTRDAAEPGRVVGLARVEPKGLLLDVAKQVEGLDAHVVPFKARLNRLQKFSIPLV